MSENDCGAFPEWKTERNNPKEAIKGRVIDVKITWTSNFKYPVTKSSNRAPVIGHAHGEPITIEGHSKTKNTHFISVSEWQYPDQEKLIRTFGTSLPLLDISGFHKKR